MHLLLADVENSHDILEENITQDGRTGPAGLDAGQAKAGGGVEAGVACEEHVLGVDHEGGAADGDAESGDLDAGALVLVDALGLDVLGRWVVQGVDLGGEVTGDVDQSGTAVNDGGEGGLGVDFSGSASGRDSIRDDGIEAVVVVGVGVGDEIDDLQRDRGESVVEGNRWQATDGKLAGTSFWGTLNSKTEEVILDLALVNGVEDPRVVRNDSGVLVVLGRVGSLVRAGERRVGETHQAASYVVTEPVSIINQGDFLLLNSNAGHGDLFVSHVTSEELAIAVGNVEVLVGNLALLETSVVQRTESAVCSWPVNNRSQQRNSL